MIGIQLVGRVIVGRVIVGRVIVTVVGDLVSEKGPSWTISCEK